jgi:ketosteroid isomerase-like protein
MTDANWTMDTRELADRIAIRECIDRFSTAMTQRDLSAIAPLFLTDGSWGADAPLDFVMTGADVIAGAMEQNAGVFEFSMHMVHSVVIDLDGDRASARTVLQERTNKRDGSGGMLFQGIYHDELHRTQAGWRFASRRFQPVCIERIPPASPPPEA